MSKRGHRSAAAGKARAEQRHEGWEERHPGESSLELIRDKKARRLVSAINDGFFQKVRDQVKNTPPEERERLHRHLTRDHVLEQGLRVARAYRQDISLPYRTWAPPNNAQEG